MDTRPAQRRDGSASGDGGEDRRRRSDQLAPPPGGQGEAHKAPACAGSLVVGRYMGSVVVTLHGDLDESCAGDTAAVLEDLIDGQGNLALVIDLRDVARIDASGTAVLSAAADRLAGHGGQVRLASPTMAVADALGSAGLANLVMAGADVRSRQEH